MTPDFVDACCPVVSMERRLCPRGVGMALELVLAWRGVGDDVAFWCQRDCGAALSRRR